MALYPKIRSYLCIGITTASEQRGAGSQQLKGVVQSSPEAARCIAFLHPCGQHKGSCSLPLKKGSAGDTEQAERSSCHHHLHCAAPGTGKAELCLLIRPHVRQIDISVSEQIIFKASKGRLEVKWHCAYPQPFPGQPHTPDLCWSHLPTAHSAKGHGNSYPMRC